MAQQSSQGATTSDESLVLLARAGDRAAFAELWERHARSGLRVARQFTSSLDADDLVSEAYTRIYQAILDGGGPNGAFRPYLYTTIRNLASRWGGNSRDVQVEDIDAFEDERLPEDPSAAALDRSLTVRAFRSLPERWQAVLWYTEVEGMDPHEVAPVLGITANGVAALSYRAREGLRKAWLQAHIFDAGATDDCRWTIQRLGENARHSLTDREQARIDRHLLGCTKCGIISEEVEDVGSRLALVMLPLLLGGTVGGTLLASLSAPAGAAAAQLAIPTMPPAFDALAVAGAGAPSVALGLGASSTLAAPVLVGALALALVVGGGVTTTLQPSAPADAAPAPMSQPLNSSRPGDGVAASSERAVSPADIPAGIVDDALRPDGAVGGIKDVVGDVGDAVGGVVGGVVGGATDLLGGVVGLITGDSTPPEGHTAPGGIIGTDVSLSLAGTGTPGAHLSLQAAGQVYATTTVDAGGRFVLNVTTIPAGLTTLDLVQSVDRGYLLGTLGLSALLGQVDKLIDALIQPLALSSDGDSPIAIRLLS